MKNYLLKNNKNWFLYSSITILALSIAFTILDIVFILNNKLITFDNANAQSVNRYFLSNNHNDLLTNARLTRVFLGLSILCWILTIVIVLTGLLSKKHTKLVSSVTFVATPLILLAITFSALGIVWYISFVDQSSSSLIEKIYQSLLISNDAKK